tara:strand:- start:191 stop:571 length:381 start_codon:yes stop_codon:yes gene_type:complete
MNSDLTWLPNSLLKDLHSPPSIVYEPYVDQQYRGYYTHGTAKLVIVETDEELIQSTIAHEFRHMLQYFSGRPLESTSFESTYENYEDQITKYFTNSWSEYDALQFEYKHSKNWLNEWWLKKLVHKN